MPAIWIDGDLVPGVATKARYVQIGTRQWEQRKHPDKNSGDG